MARAVQMYRDRLSVGDISQLGPRREVGELLGVSESTLKNWIRRERGVTGTAIVEEDGETVEQQNARLRRENARLRRAIEILKTSSAFSQRRSSTARSGATDRPDQGDRGLYRYLQGQGPVWGRADRRGAQRAVERLWVGSSPRSGRLGASQARLIRSGCRGALRSPRLVAVVVCMHGPGLRCRRFASGGRPGRGRCRSQCRGRSGASRPKVCDPIDPHVLTKEVHEGVGEVGISQLRRGHPVRQAA